MQAENISHMLNFTFQKSSKEIVAASTKKAAELRAKIIERERRITKIREENGITDAVLIDVLTQARSAAKANAQSYTSNVRVAAATGGLTEQTVTVNAGTVNNLLTEKDFIDAERMQADKLDVIGRNLQDLPDAAGVPRGHKLAHAELVYLGF
jgi:hypothetical protein